MKLIILILATLFAISSCNNNNLIEYNFENIRSPRAKELLNEIFHNHQRLDNTKKLTATINEYMDILVEELASFVKKNNMDPFALTDIIKEFSHKILFITYHGEMKLTKGELYDLTTVQRAGDCNLRYDSLFLNVQVPISFKKLLANFDYSVKFMNLGPTGQLDGSINKATIFVNVLIDLKALKLYIQDFNIEKIGHIDIEFKGHALIDWFFDILSDITTTIFNGLFTGILENQVKDMVEVIVQTINDDLENTFG